MKNKKANYINTLCFVASACGIPIPLHKGALPSLVYLISERVKNSRTQVFKFLFVQMRNKTSSLFCLKRLFKRQQPLFELCSHPFQNKTCYTPNCLYLYIPDLSPLFYPNNSPQLFSFHKKNPVNMKQNKLVFRRIINSQLAITST